jgi:hypothetical protein
VRHQYSFNEDPVGCGILGCFGGLIFGLFGGSILLVVAALISAGTESMPMLNPASPTNPDLRVTVDESFLNRFAQQPAEGSVSIDVLPGNQVQLIANTNLEAFGINAPVQVTGLFEIQFIDQTLTVQLIDTQVLGIVLPPDLTNLFSDDIPIINQDLSNLIDNISTVLGTPIIITRINTTDTQIQLEIREGP